MEKRDRIFHGKKNLTFALCAEMSAIFQSITFIFSPPTATHPTTPEGFLY